MNDPCVERAKYASDDEHYSGERQVWEYSSLRSIGRAALHPTASYGSWMQSRTHQKTPGPVPPPSSSTAGSLIALPLWHTPTVTCLMPPSQFQIRFSTLESGRWCRYCDFQRPPPRKIILFITKDLLASFRNIPSQAQDACFGSDDRTTRSLAATLTHGFDVGSLAMAQKVYIVTRYSLRQKLPVSWFRDRGPSPFLRATDLERTKVGVAFTALLY